MKMMMTTVMRVNLKLIISKWDKIKPNLRFQNSVIIMTKIKVTPLIKIIKFPTSNTHQKYKERIKNHHLCRQSNKKISKENLNSSKNLQVNKKIWKMRSILK